MTLLPLPFVQRLQSALLLLLLGATAPLSCASLGEPVVGTGPGTGYPPWVVDGTCVATEGQTSALFGLGAVRGIRNVALARSTADNRARAELARLLDAFVVQWLQACRTEGATALMENPKATATAPPAATASAGASDDNDGQGAQGTAADLTKLLTASNLAAVQVVEHHFHPHDGAVFSLARLDVAHMVQHLQGLPDLAAPLRTCLTSTSTQVVAQLIQEQRPSARRVPAPPPSHKDAQ